jgi:hypothetical protein
MNKLIKNNSEKYFHCTPCLTGQDLKLILLYKATGAVY